MAPSHGSQNGMATFCHKEKLVVTCDCIEFYLQALAASSDWFTQVAWCHLTSELDWPPSLSVRLANTCSIISEDCSLQHDDSLSLCRRLPAASSWKPLLPLSACFYISVLQQLRCDDQEWRLYYHKHSCDNLPPPNSGEALWHTVKGTGTRGSRRSYLRLFVSDETMETRRAHGNLQLLKDMRPERLHALCAKKLETCFF